MAGLSSVQSRGETRRGKDDVVGLPFAGRARDIHERRILSVHRGGLAVGIREVVIAVEHLDLELAQQEHTAVAAPLAVALHLGRRGELDVQLKVGELLLGLASCLCRSAARRPSSSRSPATVGHLPCAEIVCPRQAARSHRTEAARRSSSRAGVTIGGMRPRAVVDAPLAVRLHRRVVVADRRLLGGHGARSTSEARSR